MNSCLCEHQVLSARSWPVTALEMDMPARLTDWLLLSSGEEHALLHSPRVWVSWECGPWHCFYIFWQIQKRVPCTQYVLCNDSQPIQTRDEKLHVHLRMTPKLRPSHQVSQASGEATRNQERGTEWQTPSGEPGVGPQSQGTHAGRVMPLPVSCFHLLARRGTVCRLGKNCRHH